MSAENPTIGELVTKALEIDTYLKAEDDAHDARLRPYREGLALIKATVLGMLQASGQQNAKIEGEGTAYQQTTMTIKVDSRDTFLDFVKTNGKWDMVQVGALKDPVQQYLDDNNGVPPPGLKIDFFTKCNIRRS